MNRLRSKLTYANVVATLALFLVLAGGSAFAAKHMLAKNSVGTKQIENNAITGAKIKNGAITGAKIAAGSIGGSSIDRGSLGTVPSATHAATADQATAATTATSAATATRAITAERTETVPTPEALHVVTAFEPGCAANGTENLGPVGFYKNAFGEVRLVGSVFCATEGADAFVLPPGFRPTTEILQPTIGSKEGAELLVLPSGVVRPFASKSATLFGVSFRTN
jgi:hypothetical protein